MSTGYEAEHTHSSYRWNAIHPVLTYTYIMVMLFNTPGNTREFQHQRGYRHYRKHKAKTNSPKGSSQGKAGHCLDRQKKA